MNICWITIYVKDMAESLKFYTQILELIFDPNRKEVSCAADVSAGFRVDSLDKTDPNGLKIQLTEQN